MANRQYIGARYVPKFYEGSNGNNWEGGKKYEPLTVVTYLQDSYTSKIPVPNTVGDPAHNPKYWAHTGAYNAQVEQYRQQLINGQIGNGEYDPDISPVSYADDFNFDEAFLNHSTSETVETDDECPTPIIVAQKQVTYNDPDGTADENFKFPVSQYNEAVLQGYSANAHEAITQNFTNIYSTVKHRVAGIVGACCFGGRMRMPKLADAPAMATYGGNKGAIYDGHLFTETEYELGGYGLGAEIGIFDERTSGTSPVYENNDYNVFTRKTHVLNIVGGGHTQPITAGIVIMGVGRENSMWNGIIMGSSSMLITKNGVKQAGVKGTVGINFASWRDYNNGVGGFGHTAIKFGKAYRHIDAPNGLIVSSTAHEFVDRSNSGNNYFRLVANDNQYNVLQFGYSADVEADTIEQNVTSQFLVSKNSFVLETFNTPIEIYDMERSEGNPDVKHGIVITQHSLTPINDRMTNGYYNSPWDMVCSKGYQISDGTGVKFYGSRVTPQDVDPYMIFVSNNEPIRIADRTVSDDYTSDYGIVIDNTGVIPATSQTKLGTSANKWSEIHGTTLYVGNTSLSESQLQALLALL